MQSLKELWGKHGLTSGRDPDTLFSHLKKPYVIDARDSVNVATRCAENQKKILWTSIHRWKLSCSFILVRHKWEEAMGHCLHVPGSLALGHDTSHGETITELKIREAKFQPRICQVRCSYSIEAGGGTFWGWISYFKNRGQQFKAWSMRINVYHWYSIFFNTMP